MNPRWILGIDMGNGGAKVAAIAPDGEILGTAIRGVGLTVRPDGTATQDAEEWFEAFVTAVRDLLARTDVAPSGLHAIGITGAWGSTVPVGRDGRPVGPIMLWADTRARRHAATLMGGPLNVDGYALHKVLPWIRMTGGAPSPQGSDPTGHSLLLQNELQDIGRRTAVLLEPVDYLAFRLTGRVAASPASMILSWITDNRIGAEPRYVPDLVRRARRDPRLLPPLIPTGSIQGPLRPDSADLLGLPAGVPVAAGISDLHAATIGSGAVGPFDTHLAVSTTAWLSAPVTFKKTDVLHQIATVPGMSNTHHLVINNIDTAGSALTWLREQIIAPQDGLLGGGSGIGAGGAADERLEPGYDDLTALAATAPPGCEGLFFAPWLAGERSPKEDKNIRGTWLNLTLRTDRAMLIRSVLEGVAYNVRWLFDHYSRFLGRPIPVIRLLGGAAESDLWSEILAGVVDVPMQRVSRPRHAQLRGVALWTRVCLGEITTAEAGRLVRVDRTFHPSETARDEYQRRYEQYGRIYPTVRGFYRRINGGAAGVGGSG